MIDSKVSHVLSGAQLIKNILGVRAVFTVLCASLLCTSTVAAAQAGNLDTTFGTNGIFTFSLSTINGSNSQANAVALQSDGKIVVAGQMGSRSGLLRLNTDGTLDSTFGSGGTVISTIGSDIEQTFVGMAIQSDGKIVVAATGCPPAGVVARFNTNGSLDTTFGTNGLTSLPLIAKRLALQSDGKIVVVGASLDTGLMARLLGTGLLDSTFGTNGVAAVAGIPTATATLPDGKILIGSGGLVPSPFLNPAPVAGGLARYNINGSLDTSFAISGQAGSVVAPSAIAIQSNGRILVAGANATQLAVTGNASGFGVGRFYSNGSVDTTFGTNGGVTSGFPNMNLNDAFAIVIQPNGDIVAAGEAGSTAASGSPMVESFALARYLGTGTLDSTFGTEGQVTTSLGKTAVAFITSMALQSDGNIVVAGSTGGTSVVVARYLGQ